MGETSWENLSEEECVRRLVRGIKVINLLYESGFYCCDAAKGRRYAGYAWHNPLFPPEYRRNCLKGKDLETNFYYDVYYFAASYYEKMTGRRAPYDFSINHSWKEDLKRRMEGWDAEYQEVTLALIEQCTKRKRGGEK